MCEQNDFLPLSALQHMIFCDRQAALIHLERLWLESTRTLEGSDLHRVVDEGSGESRGDVLIRRGVNLRSERLRLTGKADVVEFHRVPAREASGCVLEGQPGRWRPYPIEYKRGRPKQHRADEVQLCAQAICIEEAFGAEVEVGALFYAQTRRRQVVALDGDLRELTQRTARSLHEMIEAGVTPVRTREKKCDLCSLLPACLPPRRSQPSVDDYLRDSVDADPSALEES
jgi:CRISPR-associated exonuclease Cas4